MQQFGKAFLGSMLSGVKNSLGYAGFYLVFQSLFKIEDVMDDMLFLDEGISTSIG